MVTRKDRGGAVGGRAGALIMAAAAMLAGAPAALGVGDVVISQVWGGISSVTGDVDLPKADYVELYNRTGSAVMMNNWSISVDTATGTSWTTHNLPNASIPAYSYYLIQVSATANNGIDIFPDTTFAAPTYSELTTTGKVVLRSSQTAPSGCPPTDVIDLVTYSTSSGTCFEGTGRAPSNSTTGAGLAAFRQAGGCTDTDDNAADFTTGIPDPRNSSTPSPGGCTSGACCNDSSGVCTLVLGMSNCPGGSTYEGDNTTCDSNPCDPTGSCCDDCQFTCTVTTAFGCTATGFTWTTGQTCTVNPCPGNYAAPANDEPCGAQALVLNQLETGQVGSATEANDGSPSTCDATVGKGVWYSYTPAMGASGYYSISTCGSSFSNVLTVFSGTCSSLTEVACDSGACTGGSGEPSPCGTNGSTLASVVEFVYLTELQPYFFRVQTSTPTLLGGSFPISITTVVAGACCHNTTGACTTTLASGCNAGTSTFQGNGTVCSPDPCPKGACCNTVTGNCTITADIGCTAGTYQGNNSVCVPSPCPDQADIGIARTLDLPPPCATAGASLSTAFTLTNNGPADATNVTVHVVVPPAFGFTSSTPSGSVVNGVLSVNLGTITVGNNAVITLNGTAVPGAGATGATFTHDQPDPGTGNNTAAAQTLIVSPTATSAVEVLLSDVPGSSTSVLAVSGSFPGANIQSGAESFTRAHFSPDGSRYIVSIDTDLATSQDRVLVVGTTNPFTVAVVAQEGVTELSAGETVGEFDYGMGINNAGDYVWSTTTSASSNNDVIVRSNGTTHTVVIREGDAAAAIGGGVTYSGANTAYAIRERVGSNPGQIAFLATLAGTSGTSTDTAVFDHDGATLIGQEGTTGPGNAGGETYKGFITPVSGNVGEGMTVFGTNGYTLSATVNGSTSFDDVLVVDGSVVLREGDMIAGFGGDLVTGVHYNNHALNGDWISYGSTGGAGIDFTMRNGVVVTKTDTLASTSGPELWDDASYTNNNFGFVANGTGDYVVAATIGIGGFNATPSNAQLVANGTTVLSRENDPIDLNGNGMLDDDTYISTYRDDRMYLSNGGQMYFNARLRTQANSCGATTDTYQAMMRVGIGGNGACCCGSTCSITTAAACMGANTSFAGTGTSCTPFSNTVPCCRGDYNKSGGAPSVQDIFDFLAGYFGMNSCADANDSGGNPSVQDIFDFLAAYFGGC